MGLDRVSYVLHFVSREYRLEEVGECCRRVDIWLNKDSSLVPYMGDDQGAAISELALREHKHQSLNIRMKSLT